MPSKAFSCVLVGSESLLIRCGDVLLAHGHSIRKVITKSADVVAWSASKGIPSSPSIYDISAERQSFDFLFSIAHLELIPDESLALPRIWAINFHDGPLPAYAGLNTPTWALANGETEHGVTWHIVDSDVDAGAILEEQTFEITPNDTSFSLNAKAYEAGIESFGRLLDKLSRDEATPRAQAGDRTLYLRSRRPAAGALLLPTTPALDQERLIRALDFGRYDNSIGIARLPLRDANVFIVAAQVVGGRNHDATPGPSGDQASAGSNESENPGRILKIDGDGVIVQTRRGAIRYTQATDETGSPVELPGLLESAGCRVGDHLPVPEGAELDRFVDLDRLAGRAEALLVSRLVEPHPLRIPFAARRVDPSAREQKSHTFQPVDIEPIRAHVRGSDDPAQTLAGCAAVFLGFLADQQLFDIAVRGTPVEQPWEVTFSNVVPARFDLTDRLESVSAACSRAMQELRERRESGVLRRDIQSRYAFARARIESEGAAGERRYPPLAESTVSILFSGDGVSADGDSSAGDSSAGDSSTGDDTAETSTRELTTRRPLFGGDAALTIEARADGINWHFNIPTPGQASTGRLVSCFDRFLGVLSEHPETALCDLDLLAPEERNTLLNAWNATDAPVDESFLVHRAFEQQAHRSPEALAVSWSGGQLSYAELDQMANSLAVRLRAQGVGLNTNVGVCTDRSGAMLIAILAVLKNGAAYVPLDPSFPVDRMSYIAEDAGVRIVVSEPHYRATLEQAGLDPVMVNDGTTSTPHGNDADMEPMPVSPDDACYIMYTSGSTGRPKGVRVLHRNVGNFFVGMDAVIEHDPPGRWLAVTSLSFDISVLELLWTLARGFEVVLHTPVPALSRRRSTSTQQGRPVDYSLFFFSSSGETSGASAYDLLLRSAEFADKNGFAAVWTPERHFHAFGGLFPNPSVVSAALAARTNNVQLRAGSCVSPLHHPVRIAEEWAVVDNLSDGRVGIAFAAGWQPHDFVLMPQNYASRKDIMFSQIEAVQSLWRGEAVPFDGHDGAPVDVRTMPRPVQPELPVWITAAGNPETFAAAGRAGYNVLTHLLGQSISDVAEKIKAYRAGRSSGGHAGPGFVSLMIHAFVHPDEDFARHTVRQPLKEYLRSAVDLVKDAAWNFPTFKEKTIDATGRFTMEHLSTEEIDAILDHAFERYFDTSGLFGTPESCVSVVQDLCAAGVDDIACLIDFGVDPNLVVESLQHLDALRKQTNELANVTNQSFAEVIRAKDVTHLQCTPSMAQMLLADEDNRSALRDVPHLFVGGEVLPGDLARELQTERSGGVYNMYGPTETTIWSTVADLAAMDGYDRDVPIGRPIANTQLYIVNSDLRLIPAGLEGELLIGGRSVADGYVNKPELTGERFVANPIISDGSTVYRTGDRCSYLEDGVVAFHGRGDRQVKVRGHRIELDEVEAAILRLDGTAQVAVAVRDEKTESRSLHAFVVPASDADLRPDVLRAALSSFLPEYMIPSHFTMLSAMPLTPSGKLDRKRLPFKQASRGRRLTPVLPSEGLEKTIADVWATALEVPSVGATDNFFDIGGHSLLAVQVIAQLVEATGVKLSLVEFFRYPTIRALAEHLEGPDISGNSSAVGAGSSRAAARRAAFQRRGK